MLNDEIIKNINLKKEKKKIKQMRENLINLG